MKFPKIDIRWLYVFYCHSLPFIHKNGISENVEKRRKEIEYDLRQAYSEPDLVLRRAICLPSIITKTQEARIHRILTKCGLKYRGIPKSVSGYSEFFWYANPISSGIICYILWSNGYDVTTRDWLLYAIIPLFPLDAALLVFAVFMAEILIFLGSVILAGAVIYHAFQFIQL